MSQRLYHFLINSFLVVTKKSYKLANTLGSFTNNALFNAKADAAILVLYNFFNPIFTAYQTAFNAWNLQQNTAQGGTLSLEQLLAGLTAKVNIWDAQILIFYQLKTSSGFKALFPHGHAAFSHGSQQEKVAAVKHLSDGMLNIAGLAATKADVDAFVALLVAAFNNKQGQHGNQNTGSNSVENQRVLVCNGLFYVYAGLVQHFITDLAQIATFIDVESMQNHQQTVFINNHLKAGAEHNICQRTLLPTDQIRLINNGEAELRFYVAQHATDPAGATFVQLPPAADVTHPASDFGDVATLHFLNVQNANSSVEGSYEVDLL